MTPTFQTSTRFVATSLAAATFGAALVLALLATAANAAPPTATNAPAKIVPNKPLTDNQKTVHVLNRLAFGPRPGDIEVVQKIGIARWTQTQLSPQTLNDSIVEKQLIEIPHAVEQQIIRMRLFDFQILHHHRRSALVRACRCKPLLHCRIFLANHGSKPALVPEGRATVFRQSRKRPGVGAPCPVLACGPL